MTATWFEDDPEMQAAALEGWMNNPLRPLMELTDAIERHTQGNWDGCVELARRLIADGWTRP